MRSERIKKIERGDVISSLRDFQRCWAVPMEDVLNSFLNNKTNSHRQLKYRLEAGRKKDIEAMDEWMRGQGMSLALAAEEEPYSEALKRKCILFAYYWEYKHGGARGVISVLNIAIDGDIPDPAALTKLAEVLDSDDYIPLNAEETKEEEFPNLAETTAGLLRIAAERGDEVALNKLADRYAVGNGSSVKLDIKLSLKYRVEACLKGDPEALLNAADSMLNGGLDKDINCAIGIYLMALRRGSIDALCKLSNIYSDGLGEVKADDNLAVFLFREKVTFKKDTLDDLVKIANRLSDNATCIYHSGIGLIDRLSDPVREKYFQASFISPSFRSNNDLFSSSTPAVLFSVSMIKIITSFNILFNKPELLDKVLEIDSLEFIIKFLKSKKYYTSPGLPEKFFNCFTSYLGHKNYLI